MKDFAALYRELDASTSNLVKQAALQRYLRDATPADAAWAVYFLAGGKPRQLVPTKLLRLLAQEAAGLPEWLFDESYDAVGDLAETIALLLPPPSETHDLGLAAWVEQHLLPLRDAAKTAPEELADRLRAQWQQLAAEERLVYFKLITGAFRVGVSKLQVTQALAAVGGIDAKRVAQRLMGYTHIGARPQPGDYHARRAGVGCRAGAEDERAALSFLPRASIQHSARTVRCGAGAAGRLDRRVEVGRHSRAAGQARGRGVAVVARRRAGDRALSRTRCAGRGAARRHGARWRNCGVAQGRDFAGRPRQGAALRRTAEAHRPQDARCQAAARHPGGAAGLRPPRMGRA
jgi:hypothetical protein